MLTRYPPQYTAERNAQLHAFYERGSPAYFRSCCLRAQHPMSLYQGADWDPSLWDTDRSWHTLNYWEPLRTKRWLEQTQRLEKQARVRARLNDKVQLPHKTPWRLGKVAAHQRHRNQLWESKRKKQECVQMAQWWKKKICQCKRHKRHGFHPCVGKIPWSRKWQPAPVALCGKVRGQRSLVGYSPWGCRVGHNWARTHTCNKQKNQIKS